MKVKYVLLMFFICFGMQKSYTQSYKFITTGYSVMEKDENDNWGKWSDLKDVALSVTLDTTKNRIIIYSQEIQLYTILKYEDKVENENDLIYPFTCTNDDGVPFTISIITRKNQENRKQLYINQKDVILLYNIVNSIDKNEK